MTDTGSTRVVEVFCACTQRPDPCPRTAVLPADGDSRPVSLAALEGWTRTPTGRVCPRCAHPDHHHIPPHPEPT